MDKLTESEIGQMLPQLEGWSLVDGKLHREFEFPDFKQAFRFMASAAPAIDKMDHHPEWTNVYNRVVVNLTTHDAGGISMKDFDLAMLLEGLSKKSA